jgi:hypothetical protein
MVYDFCANKIPTKIYVEGALMIKVASWFSQLLHHFPQVRG